MAAFIHSEIFTKVNHQNETVILGSYYSQHCVVNQITCASLVLLFAILQIIL